MSIFRLPVPTRIALGYDEEGADKKPQEDVNADLDFNDFALETYLSSAGQTASSSGTYTSFSPTVAGVGSAVGNGTLTGRKIINGANVQWFAILTVGPTTTFGAAPLQISLPATPDIVGLPMHVHILDASSGARYSGQAYITSTYAFPAVTSTGGLLVSVIAGVPVTFSTGDQVIVLGMYPKA